MSYATDVADKVFKQVSKYEISPLNPRSVCNFYDYSVISVPMPDSTLGQTVRSNRKATIFINESLDERKEDTVILHEIGHCRMHPNDSTPFMRSTMNGGWIPEIEKQANEFALHYMMRQIDEDELSRLSKPQIIQYFNLPKSFIRFI